MNAFEYAGRLDRDVAESIKQARILIADDEPMICRLLGGLLRQRGFVNVMSVGGGKAVIEQLQLFRPDLLLLDMQMPDLDGLEVCRHLRTHDAFVDVPILIQTATVDRREMGALFAAGASDFLSKPINQAELVARVMLHLERRFLVGEMREYRERISDELESARRMQAQLLPSADVLDDLTASKGMRMAAFHRSSSEIGGDIWGVLPITETSFGVFIADFTGHGVRAALNTFRLHALIHEYRLLHDDPQRLVETLNARLTRLLPPGQFATFLYALIDLAFDEITLVSAGAPHAVIVGGDEEEAILTTATGIPLGIVEHAQYEAHCASFPDGARMLMFSDGLSEHPGPGGIRAGEPGLRNIVKRLKRGLSPSEAIDEICLAVGISEQAPLPDDTTVVCIERDLRNREAGRQSV